MTPVLPHPPPWAYKKKIPLLLILLSPIVESLSPLFNIPSILHHLTASPPPSNQAISSLANVHIPRRDGGEILAYCTKPSKNNNVVAKPVLILIHEFFGLSQSICDKAEGLAQDLDCIVVAPDTFRGQSSTFIPKCIWLALSTPQGRVNQDLDDVVKWMEDEEQKTIMDTSRLAVMGFCYGGGKAIRYTTQKKPNAATVVCYGSPLTDVDALSKLKRPVCGVFGALDVQFPPPVIQNFREALIQAKVEADIRMYDNVGHAFWKDMEQIRRGDQPQVDAYNQILRFLDGQFIRRHD